MSEDTPYYKAHIFCCNNERPEGHHRGCCKQKGADALRNYMRTRIKELGIQDVRVNVSGCLDRCELGATMVIYPEGVWYTYATPQDADEIIERHLQKGERVERLLLTADQKELSEAQKQDRKKA